MTKWQNESLRARRRKGKYFLLLLALTGFAACNPTPGSRKMPKDPHSYAQPHRVAVEHLNLDLDIDFKTRTIRGRASLTIDNKVGTGRLYLDTRDLDIRNVYLDENSEPTRYRLDDPDPILGSRLAVYIDSDTRIVHIDYETSPEAAALQWLTPEQTSGGTQPFLLSQSQAILARSWIPIQDSPGVRFTYDATVRVPLGLMAVMSAENDTTIATDGVYEFTMPQPIPAYLLAIAVGDLRFKSLGSRAGVYAEPGIVDAAAWEFADIEKMMSAAEDLYGPYQWGRYDVVVLPPSFPFGGMENPRLTFATPTILAGDRSLVSLVAHELAHSWSGNLVTNATWNDFWLNEGFTTYFEHRIMEAVYGCPYQEMLAVLDYRGLRKEIARLADDSSKTRLHLDLKGRDPDEGMSAIAYDKGNFFLRMLEENVGREKWDGFLRSYFDNFAFQAMSTDQFLAILRDSLLAGDAGLEEKLQLDVWVYGVGLPPNAPAPRSSALDAVDAQVEAWNNGVAPSALDTDGWTTHHWRYFLTSLPRNAGAEKMLELDKAFKLTDSGNSEILFCWLDLAIANKYTVAYLKLESFLTGQGRRKFVRPLFAALVRTPEGQELARRIYERARPGYHSITRQSVDALLERRS